MISQRRQRFAPARSIGRGISPAACFRDKLRSEMSSICANVRLFTISDSPVALEVGSSVFRVVLSIPLGPRRVVIHLLLGAAVIGCRLLISAAFGIEITCG